MNEGKFIRYEDSDGGLLLYLKVHAKARKDDITGVFDGRIKISITQAPEKGKANTAILKFLARKLDLKRVQFQIIAGETSPLKTLRIEAMTFKKLAVRLAKLTNSGDDRDKEVL